MTTIRLAVAADNVALYHLAHAVYSAQGMEETRRQRLLERLYSPHNLQRSIENTAVALYVAQRDQIVIGLAQFGAPLLEECTDRKEIHRLLVHPTHTRSGVGGQFLQAMKSHYASDRFVRQFIVYVAVEDTTRMAFYRRQAFQRLSSQDRENDHYFYFNVL